nr:ChuX/HutX family heme-like substrate-binding protein [uncultured Massilia sp.]
MKTIERMLLAAAIAMVAQGVQAQSTLAERWNALRTAQPNLQARDAARTLQVSEAELLATNVGKGVTRLRDGGPDGKHVPREIMRRALDLGRVMALTRNENGVIETTGTASRLKEETRRLATSDASDAAEREARELNIAGGYLGGPIDLRFQFPTWRYAFAVVQPGRDGAVSRSLQFFDASGNAVHKLYLRNDATIPVFDKLVADFRAPHQDAALQLSAPPPKPAARPDSEIDVEEFRLAWKEMDDVHQFNRIVSEFHLSREQALRLGPAGMVTKVTPQAVRALLQGAARDKVAIMAFLGNPGVTQIYSGTIGDVKEAGGWFNVLDPDFNLHLRDTAFRSGYVVRRAGIVSVEFYDDQGELVVTFFGVRERGKPQPKGWIDLANGLR